jgi:glucosamine-phosphate N-acetyltransferase
MYRSSHKVPTAAKPSRVVDPDAPIFGESLIPEHIIQGLPSGYMMRSLRRTDFGRGFLDVLRVAGKVGYVNQRRWEDRMDHLTRRSACGEEYVLVVIDEKDRVIGTGRWRGEKGL